MEESWCDAVDHYAHWLAASGASPGTVSKRRYWLARLARFAGTDGPWGLAVDDLTAFLASDSDAKPWRPETRKSIRSTVRGFYSWALVTGRADTDPSASLPKVRIPAATPRPTPESVLAAAFARADERGRLLIMAAAMGGLRRSEIARMHTDDIAGTTLYVTGKGGQVRQVPLHPDLARALTRCLRGWVFPNGKGGHLTPGHVGKLLSSLLGPGYTGHQLRHSAASLAYTAERDLLAVSRILGHAQVGTTQRYTAIPDEAAQRAVAATGIGRHAETRPDESGP